MSAALEWYLQVNLLLVASYAIFRLGLLVFSRRRPSFTAATRIGQALIVASVLVPLALAFAPSQSLPRLHLGQVQPLSDGVGVVLRTQAGPRLQAALPDFVSTRNGQHLDFQAWAASAEPLLLKALFLLLVAGVAAMSLRLARNIRRLKRAIADGAVVRRIGRVLVVVTDSISVPMSTLVTTRAVVAVPPDVVSNAADFRIAIRHELQHHRQRDTAWAILVELFASLCFANPAIYLWRRQIVELQELSCDEALIGRRGIPSKDYGSCLLRAAEAALRNRQTLAGTACMAAGAMNPRYFKSFLRRRIEMFTEYGASSRTKLTAVTLGAVSLLAFGAVAFSAQQVLRPEPAAAPNPGHAAFDPAIQAIAEKALQAAVANDGAKGGFVLVSDPATGRLLAAANVTRDPQRQGRAWSLSYLMEPASAMKGLAAAAAVDRHLLTLDEQLDCENGQLAIGGSMVSDWKPFKTLSTADTIVNSSNVCGIKIGERLGVAGLSRMLTDFGFGAGGTTEGFPEAAAGEIPRPTQLTAEEYIALVAAGLPLQGHFAVSPLEMVQAYGAIANDGKLMKALPASEPASAASEVRQVIDPSTAEAMKAVLAKVVTDGTGKHARSALYTTAGKTSSASAQGPADGDSLDGTRAIAGFVGFAPVEKPRIAVYVAIIDPSNLADGQAYGSEHAAPLFRQVVEQVLQSLHVPPDQR